MEIFSYILTIDTLETGGSLYLAIRNIAGTANFQFARGGTIGNHELWLVPKSKKTKEDLLTQLKAVSFIKQISIVQLTKPINNNELFKVRELFNSLGWDTGKVKDEELSMYLNAKLHGKYTYMLDFEPGEDRSKQKLRIIRAEDHPHFSTEWLETRDEEDEILDRELTMEDLEIRYVELKNGVKDKPPKEPPPPPPGDH